MRIEARLLAVSGMVLAMATLSFAEPPDGPQAEIRKIAEALEKGDMKTAQSMGKALAEKAEMEDIMHMFSLRSSKGEGVGPTANAIKPDGIEAKLLSILKRPMSAEQLKSEGPAIERMAYIAAAIGETVVHKAPKDKKGEMDPAKWKLWCEEMSKTGVALGKEIKGGNAKKVMEAAIKLDSTCKNCHGVFRDGG